MNVKETLKDRGNKYGKFSSNAITTQGLMSMIATADHYHDLTPIHLEAIHMIMHKISRMVNGDCMLSDNPHDIGGYAKLLEDHIVGYTNDSK